MKLLFDESLSPRLVLLLRDLFPECESALRNLAASGWPPRIDQTRSIAFSPDGSPARTSLAAPETLAGTAPHSPGAGIPPRDRRRSGRQPCPPRHFLAPDLCPQIENVVQV